MNREWWGEPCKNGHANEVGQNLWREQQRNPPLSNTRACVRCQREAGAKYRAKNLDAVRVAHRDRMREEKLSGLSPGMRAKRIALMEAQAAMVRGNASLPKEIKVRLRAAQKKLSATSEQQRANARNRAYRLYWSDPDFRERKRILDRESYHRHKATRNAKHREYYQKNREKILAKAKESYREKRKKRRG